jgi:hypothetical protein
MGAPMSFQYYDDVVLCRACAGTGLNLEISTLAKHVKCEICEGAGILKTWDTALPRQHASPQAAANRAPMPSNWELAHYQW